MEFSIVEGKRENHSIIYKRDIVITRTANRLDYLS